MKQEFFELSNPQNSIWLTEQFYTNSNINNICGVFNFNSQIDTALLSKAINILAEQNDALRLRIVLKDSKPVQYISEYKEFEVPFIQMNTQDELKKLEETMTKDLFSVIESPLFKFTMFQFPDGKGGYVVTVHHLAGDAMTLGLIGNKTYEIYQKLVNNEPIEDNILFAYKNYLSSEKEYLSSEKFKKDESYWNEIYSTIPETATIPALYSKTEDIYTASRKVFEISKQQTENIKKYCQEHKISLYNFFMSVFSLYIGRVSNLSDFVIGTPILNRTNFKEKNTLGMFISNLPFRVNIDKTQTFVEYSKQIALNLTTMLRHQRYPYQYLLENLRKKDSSLPNLYNITLSYQITKASASGSGCQTDWIPAGTIADDMEIHFYDLDYSGSINIAYDYRISKYTLEEIENIQKRISHVITQVIFSDNLLMKDIDIVTPDEKHQILCDFNNTKVDYPRDKTIIELFEEQVEKTPNNIALVFEDQKLTYKELNEKANALAKHLLEKGIQTNDVVALFMDKSLEIFISILATLKCGAAYLPIDIEYPNDRISFMLEDSNSKLLLTSDKYVDNLSVKSPIMCINSLNLSNGYTNPKNLANSDSLAYIMYTSGSTGTPKGVAISNRNVVRLVENTNYIKFEDGDRILQTGSIVFDACTFEIWGAFLHGLELYLLKKEDLLNPNKLQDFLINNKITIAWFTAPLFNQLCEENPTIFQPLKYLLTGGDVLSCKHINMAKSANPSLSIINGYGPTENTTFSCCFKIDKYYSDSIPIGKPIANSTAYVVSQNSSLQPIGVPGELWVGGDGVSKGYLNRDDLTNDKFIPNPFGEGSIYKTGDLVRWLPDGTIDFIGRIDNQVKIRGFRVELSEIDSKILSYPNIKQSVTIINTIANSKSICSYIVSEESFDIDTLKKYLATQLPSYMIPAYFVRLNKLPLNINGKVDKKSLPLPSVDNRSYKIIPARNELDTTILEALAEVLHIENISIEDSFVDLGGDSLTAINLCIKLSNTLNLNITVKDILGYPVIKDLSDYISTLKSTENTVIIPKVETSDSYPVSSAQKRMYYSSTIGGDDSILYNIAGGVILDKIPDIEKLENCFKTLINRHESLRTYFDIIDGNVVQKIEENINFALETCNEQYTNINDAYNDFIKPFNLKNAPLFRAKLVVLPENKTALLLDMHHSISDGTSLSILVSELCALYNNNELPEKEIDYKDFAVWENNNLNSNYFDEAKEFWVNQYKNDITVLDMPLSNARPSMQSFEGDNVFAELDESLSNQINTLAQALNVTPYMLLLSIYYILLYKYTSNTDIVVGTPISARDNAQISNVVGMFVNTLALRQKVDSSVSFTDFLNSVKDYCLNAFKYQTYPFDELLHNLDIKRDTSRNPLFDTMFIYQNNGYPEVNFDGINANYFIPDNNISKFDLSLEVLPVNNTFKLRFEYCTKLFDKDFIVRLSSHYTNILKAILENNYIKIADIDMLSKEERHQILYDFNNTKMDYPRDKTIVQLFEEQVEKTPDNIAIVFEGQRLTYRELNEKANALAKFLIENNAKKGDIVCLLLDKSLESIISILSILKVGGIFLPIDVTYPKDRIDYIIRDSKSKMLLTTSEYLHKSNSTIQAYCIELNNSIYSKYDTNNVNIQTLPDDLVYIMYTSGSTGNPKGVMIKNQNVIRLVKNNEFITYNSNEKILQTGSIVFDACTFEIWGALLNGYELHIITKLHLLDAIYLKDYIETNKITSLFLTTQLFNQLCEADPNIFNTVNSLLTGGEAVSVKHMNIVKKVNPNLNLIHCYGPTENTTFSTCYLVENKRYKHTVPIGKPISNSTAYIVSPSNMLQPIGVPGELWVGGDGVGIGYLNNPELTNDKFITNPFGDGKIYKTGDLVKWLPDGNIEFIGRIDNQVKIRGFRIELNEINIKILDYPEVKYATTVVNNINNEKVICSYIVSDTNIDISDLRTFLKTSLPSFMIPTYIMQLENFSININGKIDKKSLPTNFRKNSNKSIIKKPTNNEEYILLEIFKSILNLDSISITDDLFMDLGGDSLIAMKIQVEALSHDIKIAYSDIFKYPTIEQLAKHINSTNTASNIPVGDYEKYNKILSKNIIDNNMNLRYTSVKNILLTGFTGFLGAHVLDSFIKKETGTIYCLIRGKNQMTAEERLKNVLHFYFETKYDKYIGNRIKLVEGDITSYNLGLSKEIYETLGNDITTVIHSAALVKHYGIYKDFENTNILGTKRIVDFCNQFNLKLLHISTLSVSGNNLAEGSNIDNNFDETKYFDETNFYIGQNLNNLYIKSKFEAEHIVLDSIYNNNLEACILRMGNLTSRFSEGKFQQNHFENAFVNRFKSFLQIGYIPEYLMDIYAEFTPIDYCGDAIINIASYFNKDYTVFHLLNEKHVDLDKLYEMMKKLNINIEVVSEKEFVKIINNLLLDPEKKTYIEGIINDFNSNKKLIYESEVKIKSDFTIEFLKQTGFEWPTITLEYIRNYFKYLSNIGYFNIDIN